jgi:hypothetical protein
MNMAAHVSASRALRPPLRTVNEEAWRTFFTGCAGRAVRHGQQPEYATAGPTGRPVLSMSGYPCRGWRDNSNKQCIIVDVTSCEVILFRPRREGCFQVFIFSSASIAPRVRDLCSSVLFTWANNSALLFEVRILISRIIFLGLTTPYCCSSRGF